MEKGKNSLPKKKIIVLSGAGMSAESGISTFRDSGGLWEQYKIEDVATYKAWEKNPGLVLEFYNRRRKQLMEVKPNAAHVALVRLEEKYDVQIITQNVDNLHERAGSTNILHLHGELTKSRSTVDDTLIYTINGWALNMGDCCEKGSQLRPHIVWFGEEVSNILIASKLVETADILLVIGTSLEVYPAAGLINYAKYGCPIYVIDPNIKTLNNFQNITMIRKKAGIAVPELVSELLNK